MSVEVMAFALALFAQLVEQDDPDWKEGMSNRLKDQFEKGVKFLKANPAPVLNKKEREAIAFYNDACELYDQNKFQEALIILHKSLPLSDNGLFKADIFNNLGYYNLRLGNYRQSAEFFKKAVELNPGFAYAADNLGYTLVQLGDLDEGKQWLDKAMKTEGNDPRYTYRNLALYYRGKNDKDLAEEYFKKAFGSMDQNVDLLEYHFAEFLFQTDRRDEAMTYLSKAVEKGEPEAIKRMEEIKKGLL